MTAFQVGWTVLHRDVCLYAARGLIQTLEGLECSDRDTWLQLEALRRELVHHVAGGVPWRARNALDAILALDAPAWAALRGLIDECPVLHAALGASGRGCRTIDPADFTFFSENREIAAVRAFMASLSSVFM